LKQRTRRASLVLGSQLLLAAPAAATFDPGDLAGNWHWFRRWDELGGHAPGWDAISAAIAANGVPSSGIYTDSEANGASVTGGSLSLDASGRFDGNIALSFFGPIAFQDWQLDLGESVLAGAGSDAFGRAVLGVGVRRGPSYSNADLIGSWTLFGFADERVTNQPHWFRAELAITNPASPVANGTAFASEDPPEPVTDLPISISATGVASAPLVELSLQMDSGKTAMAYAQNDRLDLPEEVPELLIALEHGSGFTTANLAGVWRAYSFGDDRSTPEPFWERSTVQFAADGAIVAGVGIDSGGNRSQISGGALSVTSDGAVNGTIDFADGETAVVANHRLDADGNLFAGVSSDGTGRSILIAVPEPVAGLPVGVAGLLALASRRRGQRMRRAHCETRCVAG
jgi:hypothetical protein